jgi:hypothetical protein
LDGSKWDVTAPSQRDPIAAQLPRVLTNRAPIVAHYASLVVAFLGLLWYTRRQYFSEDDWEFINRLLPGDNRLGIFVPHNEHWSTLPLLVYKGLFAVVGVHSYVPYMAVLLALHVLTAHLLWRLMLRAGADVWISTAVTAVFLVLGSGADNITWAFQIGFVGSLAAGTGMVLAVLGRTPRRLALAWLLGVISIMCSGLGPIMVAVATLSVLLRCGWRRAALTALVPAVVYASWWLVFRTTTTTPGSAHALLDLPNYVFTGITSAAAGITGLRFVGALLLLPLAAWLLLRARQRGDDAALVAMALGTPIFFVVVGLGRVALGVDEAKATRYVYITAVLLLPAVAVALSAAARRHVALLAVVGLGVVAAGYHNAHTLVAAVRDLTTARQHAEARILTAAQLVHGTVEVFGGSPEPATAPDLTWPDLVQLVDLHDLPATIPLSPDALDRATVAANVEMTTSTGAGIPSGPTSIGALRATKVAPVVDGCAQVSGTTVAVLPRVLLGFGGASSVLVRAQAGSVVTVYLFIPLSDGIASPPHPVTIGASGSAYLDVSAPGAKAVVELPPGGGTICGLRR